MTWEVVDGRIKLLDGNYIADVEPCGMVTITENIISSMGRSGLTIHGADDLERWIERLQSLREYIRGG